MSAPVLTITEQRASISGKKKKKKTMKNVLDIPSNLKVESYCVGTNEAQKLISILERLLPSARLPVERNSKSNQNSSEQTNNDTQLREEAKKKRNQLSLGVNALNRSIKQGLITAVLLADDIQPKFLTHHLNLLCNHNKIPFLEVSGLRDVTKNYLGFPCIAVGFKKDFCDFSEVVEEVKSISQTKSVAASEKSQETELESSESDEEMSDNKIIENSVKSDEIPFKYLYRTSRKERIFVPDSNDKINKLEPKTEFIAVEDDDHHVAKVKSRLIHSGISSKFVKNQKNTLKNLKKQGKDDDEDDDDDDDDEDEDLNIPKKKIKKDWVIDTVGTKQKVSYYPANLTRFSSNPDRCNRKNK